MNEIKFRAWDSTAGRMLYRTLFDRNWYSTPKNTDTGCNCVRGIKPRDCHMPTMQCTNLNKAGKDLYQGDGGEDETYGKYYIKFGEYKTNSSDHNVGFYVEWVGKYELKTYRKDLGFWILELKFDMNIHANPELLKEPPDA